MHRGIDQMKLPFSCRRKRLLEEPCCYGERKSAVITERMSLIMVLFDTVSIKGRPGLNGVLGLLNISIFKYATTANFQFVACTRGEKISVSEVRGSDNR